MVIEKIVELECPNLMGKFHRSNLAYGYQAIEYIYEAFSRNFSSNVLVSLWNFLYEDL
jgi:hypothetical protein